jgi:leucine-rich transmembrane protein, putative
MTSLSIQLQGLGKYKLSIRLNKLIKFYLVFRDLSQTSILNLPTKGLDDLETIKIIDTFTLKVFPSVFEFYNLKLAHLTYPHHCCAFKSPKFDPNYQLFQPNR